MQGDKSIPTGQSIKFAWGSFKSNPGFFLIVSLIYCLAFGLNYYLQIVTAGYLFAGFGITLLYYFFLILFSAGLTKAMLNICDNIELKFGILFSQGKLVLKFAGVYILYVLIVSLGTLLFIIPGVIWSLKYYFVFSLVIDKNMSPIEALRESAKMTEGLKWDLMGFLFVVTILAYTGIAVVLVGLMATIPMSLLATQYVYRYLAPVKQKKDVVKLAATPPTQVVRKKIPPKTKKSTPKKKLPAKKIKTVKK